MNALVYNGPGKRALEERRVPQIQAPTDAIVRILKTTICGTGRGMVTRVESAEGCSQPAHRAMLRMRPGERVSDTRKYRF